MLQSKLALLAALGLVLVSGPALAQMQSSAQQKCINTLNKDGAAVAKAQGAQNRACIKAAGAGTIGTPALNCFDSDPKLKITKANAKTTKDNTKLCTETPPDFAYTDDNAVNNGGRGGRLNLIVSLFGNPMDYDTVLASCTTSPAACACQAKIYADANKLADAKLGIFLKCKQAALKAGATSVTAIEDCVYDPATPGSIAADTKGTIQKSVAKITADVISKCDDEGVTTAFPGNCTSLSGSALGQCIDTIVECRTCQAIVRMDDLTIDCDLFDDGAVNSSCVAD
jgi:hypothetical protein